MCAEERATPPRSPLCLNGRGQVPPEVLHSTNEFRHDADFLERGHPVSLNGWSAGRASTRKGRAQTPWQSSGPPSEHVRVGMGGKRLVSATKLSVPATHV